MVELTFKQTNSELLVRAAATVLFGTLVRCGVKIVSISTLAENPQYGFTASAASEPVGPRLVRITDLKDGRIDWDTVPFCECSNPEKYLLRDDDLLFARTGATTGKTHLVRGPENAVFASYLIRLRPKHGVFAGYLYAFFQSDNYWSQISEEKEGSAQPNVNGEKLAALEIPLVNPELQRSIAEFIWCVRRRQDGENVELPELPAPLSEQRRIVARIEELAAKINEARALRQEAVDEADLLVTRATSALVDTSTWRRLELRTVLSEKPRNGLGPKSEASSGGRRMLRINAVSSSATRYVDVSASKVVDVDDLSAEPFVMEDGDVFIVRYNGDINRVAKPAIYRGANEERVVYPDKLIRLRTNPEMMSPDFLVFALNSRTARSQIEELGKTTAGNIGVSGGDAQSLVVPVPPLGDQRRIIAELDGLQTQVDALKRLQAETQAELDALLPAILDRAFKGEL